ncbi:MAG: hypothetical protein IIA60_05560 [Candidatus Marinimicrobia bacterium]|nr:hypothetical protein [Candidatus Neomarinimicrobiota bacterium]
MALDDQAMEFQIGMDIKDLLARVDDLESSFENFVKAGEEAGESAVKTAGFMDMMAASAETAGIAVKALTVSAVALGLLGIAALADSFVWLIKKGFEANEMFRDLAVRTGMNVEEMDRYGDVVFEATQRYGMALREVNTIATFVATNSLRSRKSIEEWTDALASLQTFTKSNEETTRTFGDLAINMFRLSGKEAKKFGFGVRMAWKTANMTMDEGVMILDSLREVLALVPGRAKEMAMQIAVASAAMRDQGFSAEKVISLIGKLGDENTKLGQQFFKLARTDMRIAVVKMQEYFKTLGITSDSLGRVAENNEISKEELKLLLDTTISATKANKGYAKGIGMTTQEVEDYWWATASLGDIWEKTWNKLRSVFTAWGSHIAKYIDIPVRAFLVTMGKLTERFRNVKTWGEFVGVLKDEWKKFATWWDKELTPTLSENWDKVVKWWKDTALPAMEDVFVDWAGPFSNRMGKLLWQGMKDWVTDATIKVATLGFSDVGKEQARSARIFRENFLRRRSLSGKKGLDTGAAGFEIMAAMAAKGAAAPGAMVKPTSVNVESLNDKNIVEAAQETTKAVKAMHKDLKTGGANRHQPTRVAGSALDRRVGSGEF